MPTPPQLPEVPGPSAPRGISIRTIWIMTAVAMVGTVVAGLAIAAVGRAMLRHEGVALAAAAVPAIAIWLALMLGPWRTQRVWIKAGAALALLLWSGITVDLVCTITRQQERDDLRAWAQIKIAPDGTPYLPPGVEGGRITRATSDFLRFTVGRDLARRAVYARLGFVRMDPLSERTEKTLFTDCGRFARAKPEIDAIDDSAFHAIAAFHTRLGELVDDPGYRSSVIASFDANYAPAPAHRQRRRELVDHSLDQMGALCTVMARRNWRIDAKGWSFTSDADRADYFRLRAAIERDRQEMDSFTPPPRYKLASPSPKLAPGR